MVWWFVIVASLVVTVAAPVVVLLLWQISGQLRTLTDVTVALQSDDVDA
ncbi:hypothetical protein [Serinicoccus sediminis]|nr:hypothetical protein [Serinicoccus sediminis]